MPKEKKVYSCQACGYSAAQWLGQCPECGGWNTFTEEVVRQQKVSGVVKNQGNAIKLSEVMSTLPKRLSSQISEFDRVLGGGFVPGQVILLAGEPGIGKSTLLTQIAKSMANQKILYVCGEESVDQIKVRALRMNYPAANMSVFPETNVEAIIDLLSRGGDEGKYDLVVVDSIQTLNVPGLESFSGSLVQVRGGAQLLTEAAKRTGVPVVLVGHVTKEGVVAGPKVLEHIVDTVLYLEGDSQHLFRILRTSKNRFGPVSEVGIFEMIEDGMREVANPSEAFLDGKKALASGSCVTVVMEGFRPILFEVQALTVPTAFGYPRRTTSGYNVNRLQVLIALLEKRCGLKLGNFDIYLSIAGGFKVSEYAADLAVCAAVYSSVKDVALKKGTVVFGECGLGGEVRQVSHLKKRIAEAKKLGYTNIVGPDKVHTLKEALTML